MDWSPAVAGNGGVDEGWNRLLILFQIKGKMVDADI